MPPAAQNLQQRGDQTVIGGTCEERRPIDNSVISNACRLSSRAAIRDQIHRAARWLEAAPATIPRKPDGEPDVILEIAPSYALDADELQRQIRRRPTLERKETIYIS